MLVFKYLEIWGNPDLENNSTQKAEFLSQLLGRGKDNIRQYYSDFYNKVATVQNLKKVLELFREVGFIEPLERVEKQLKNKEQRKKNN